MATLQASISSSSLASFRKIKYASPYSPKLQSSSVSVPKNIIADEVLVGRRLPTLKTSSTPNLDMKPNNSVNKIINASEAISNPEVVQELYAILEIVADRIEMHKNIGAQRDNWNVLLLNSVNGMTVAAATMAGLGAISGVGASLLALKLSSSLLYMAATGILLVMNKIQPSQLAEEQRNASRLFKQLYEEIRTTLALRNPTASDVNELMQKVLALDKAYPLPLLGVMLDKFPASVKPAVWWPHHLKPEHDQMAGWKEGGFNGWNEKLEEEMKEIVGVVRRKDSAEYVRLSKVALKVSKVLALSGPFLTGLAAVGSAFMGTLPGYSGTWATICGVMFGALATVVNTLEHGGQVGMVFEMYRNSAGFYKLMEETIESNLSEGEVDKRENGKMFEVKVALLLGRSLTELRDLASASLSSSIKRAKEENASKLF